MAKSYYFDIKGRPTGKKTKLVDPKTGLPYERTQQILNILEKVRVSAAEEAEKANLEELFKTHGISVVKGDEMIFTTEAADELVGKVKETLNNSGEYGDKYADLSVDSLSNPVMASEVMTDYVNTVENNMKASKDATKAMMGAYKNLDNAKKEVEALNEQLKKENEGLFDLYKGAQTSLTGQAFKINDLEEDNKKADKTIGELRAQNDDLIKETNRKIKKANKKTAVIAGVLGLFLLGTVGACVGMGVSNANLRRSYNGLEDRYKAVQVVVDNYLTENGYNSVDDFFGNGVTYSQALEKALAQINKGEEGNPEVQEALDKVLGYIEELGFNLEDFTNEGKINYDGLYGKVKEFIDGAVANAAILTETTNRLNMYLEELDKSVDDYDSIKEAFDTAKENYPNAVENLEKLEDAYLNALKAQKELQDKNDELQDELDKQNNNGNQNDPSEKEDGNVPGTQVGAGDENDDKKNPGHGLGGPEEDEREGGR